MLLQAVHLSGYSVMLPRNNKAASAASPTGIVYLAMDLQNGWLGDNLQ